MTHRLFDRELPFNPSLGEAIAGGLTLDAPLLLMGGRLPIGSSMPAAARPIRGADAG
jgi:hypothetical protein